MNSSKGNQYKFRDGSYWYKKDSLGYEALAETVVSFILNHSNVSGFVEYSPCKKEFKGALCNFSRSKNFLMDGQKLVTLQRFFELEYGIELNKKILDYQEVTDRIRYVVDYVESKACLAGFGQYLTLLLEIDAITLDDDRHFHNIALIYDGEKYSLPPLFDFGAAFLSDMSVDYPRTDSDIHLDRLIEKSEAKPFCRNYNDQVDAAEELYGTQLKISCTANAVCEEAQRYSAYYDSGILTRIQHLVRVQWRKYSYLCSGADVR